jgi:nucleotide-binding universal stress UspA family protein
MSLHSEQGGPRPVEPDRWLQEVRDEALTPDDRTRRIVVGLDGSYGCVVALRWAAGQARERGCVLDVVSVWEDLVAGEPTLARAEEPVAVARERLHRALAELFRDPNPPERVITAPLHGPPGRALVERAREAEMLVLGTTGISSPEIPGGVGLYCLRHSSAPVVFVPGQVP